MTHVNRLYFLNAQDLYYLFLAYSNLKSTAVFTRFEIDLLDLLLGLFFTPPYGYICM